MNKKVKYILPAEMIDMGGFPVKQALPTSKVPQIDPFLLLHHARVSFDVDRLARHQGVGPHPHRGFSPVTFVIKGEVHHRDSRGNSQLAKAGEVQWINAGMGIIHSERPSRELVISFKEQEIIQLWINTPAAHKMDLPEYFHLSRAEMPTFSNKDKTVQSLLVAGNYKSQEGKIPTKSELLILWGRAKKGGKEIFDIPEGFNASIYLINGSLKIAQHGLVDPECLILFENEGNQINLECISDCEFLVLAGKPLDEKVVQFGPYVMNSETEIMQAMRDYQMGKMGILIEED